MPLNDKAILALKPSAKFYQVADGEGLSIEVAVSGSKLWRFRYRFGGRERIMSFGKYPEVTLKVARGKKLEARLMVQDGVDPGLERKRAKLVATANAANTFETVAAEFVETKLVKEGNQETTIAKNRWLIEQLKAIGKMPVVDIRPTEIMAVLKRLEGHGKHETAKRARSFASRVFRYAVATGRAEIDPAALLGGGLIAPKVKHHAAILEPSKFGELMRSIDQFTGSPIVRLAMQIAPHVMTRPGELRKATWDEINLDQKVWTIAAGRMKMRKEHAVPLSDQVIAYLRELHELTGPTDFVFPAFHTSLRPMSENTVNMALRRMGYTSDEVTAHGLRTTASTLLNESGLWHPDAIERALAHGDSNQVRGIYNRGQYWDERVRMAQWWSDLIDRLRCGGQIVPFEKKAKG